VQGAAAPDFTLQSLGGEMVRLSDFKGHPILINFWATWCGPCRLEMPAISARYEQYMPELIVLAVDFAENENQVAAFTDELGLAFDPLLDPPGAVSDLYLVRHYPTSFFVDKEGVIQAVHIGFMTEDKLDELLGLIGLGVE
jgi:peroxiredoxin